MEDVTQVYNPTLRQTNVNHLYGNHFRFEIEALPDVTFFCQSVTIPGIQTSTPQQPNPFVVIPQVGDHLEFSSFDVSFILDRKLKTYFSIYWWLVGYGFPRSYEEIEQFQQARKARLANPRPYRRDIEKSRAILSVLQPDTNSAIAEVHYEDIFPTGLSSVEFRTTESAPAELIVRATFACTDMHVILTDAS